jgi:hypothetical protein
MIENAQFVDKMPKDCTSVNVKACDINLNTLCGSFFVTIFIQRVIMPRYAVTVITLQILSFELLSFLTMLYQQATLLVYLVGLWHLLPTLVLNLGVCFCFSFGLLPLVFMRFFLLLVNCFLSLSC